MQKLYELKEFIAQQFSQTATSQAPLLTTEADMLTLDYCDLLSYDL